MRFETKAVQAARETDPITGALVPPIHQSATFVQEEPGVHKGYPYGRTGNPTRALLERAIATLENGRYGLAFASGLAAEDAILHLLQPGDHVLCCDDVYGGTYRLFEQVRRRYGLEFSYFDTTDATAVKPQKNTKLIWLESPTNPLLKIADISAVAERKGNALLVVDNTFATPYLQRPLELGADIVVHSSTKYLSGHGDVIGGLIVTSNAEVYERLKFLQNAIGAVPGPFDCWLVLRGFKTLALRMKAHSENAQAVAEFLSKHRKVERVYYPGLPSHPGHAIAKRQMNGLYSGMLSFELKGNVKKFVQATKVFVLAENLGVIESLTTHPATMTHASIPPEERARRGIKDNLVRLSVGIENAQDLIEDLQQALEYA
ncbi:MAG: PLP-dependent aspartate aminotransferase family protein [Candidatus Bipolaricaulota bacterium]|nr:PLP-dependent aspartate aminotransferase family protein [Candidatus Bipolaricaulota bacterium]